MTLIFKRSYGKCSCRLKTFVIVIKYRLRSPIASSYRFLWFYNVVAVLTTDYVEDFSRQAGFPPEDFASSGRKRSEKVSLKPALERQLRCKIIRQGKSSEFKVAFHLQFRTFRKDRSIFQIISKVRPNYQLGGAGAELLYCRYFVKR